jgi:hypothetical protein
MVPLADPVDAAALAFHDDVPGDPARDLGGVAPPVGRAVGGPGEVELDVRLAAGSTVERVGRIIGSGSSPSLIGKLMRI